MIVFDSIPALGLWIAAVVAAIASRSEKIAWPASFICMFCAAALIVLALILGASLHEALAYLLLPLSLLLPRVRF